MTNYFRITAYHPEKDISAIFDSNGYFEKLWQFSSFLVNKGFKILVVTAESKITKTNIPTPKYSPNNLILRACIKGKVDTSNNYTEINGRWYTFR